MKPSTYRAAGVDIEAGDEAVRRIAPLARATFRPEVLGGIGAFAGFVKVPAGYTEPVLVSSTDGVGTKLKVAFLVDRHDTVGIDLVAMSVNDLLVHGAEPLYFLDYIGIPRLDPARVEAIVRGVAEGCRQAGCALIGGETAELPDLYAPGEYDLAGFAVGIVKLDVDALLPGTGRTVGDVLLEPTRIYVRAVLPVRDDVHAMANVTGGGITGNLPRVLPEGCRAIVRPRRWASSAPPVFAALRAAGRVEEAEMFRTFNMGLGYLLVLPADRADRVTRALTASGETVHAIGEIVAGERGVELVA